MPLLNLVTSVARELLGTFLSNYLFAFLYVVIIVLIRMQYKRYTDLQSDIHRLPGKSLREVTEEIILLGLVTGFAGSFIMIAAGITIDTAAVRPLFYIMLLLSIINLRFLCIAYPAGILSLIILIFNYPKADVSSILGLAAIMHMIESLLIYLDKGRDSIPVFIKHKNDIAGAYLIRKFWPAPVVFFTFLAQNAAGTSASLPFSGGRLFTPGTLQTGVYALGLDCILAVLCYSDLAITRHPEKKSREAALLIFCYSTILFVIALVSTRIPWLKYAGAIFCIVAHEGITLYGRHAEKNGIPLFKSARRGLKVMDVIPGGHAQKMGIQRGDTILSINGKDVQTEEGVHEALREYPNYIWVQVAGWDGIEKTCEYKSYPEGCSALGIVSVPREREVTYVTDYFEHLSVLKNIVTRFKSVNKSL